MWSPLPEPSCPCHSQGAFGLRGVEIPAEHFTQLQKAEWLVGFCPTSSLPSSSLLLEAVSSLGQHGSNCRGCALVLVVVRGWFWLGRQTFWQVSDAGSPPRPVRMGEGEGGFFLRWFNSRLKALRISLDGEKKPNLISAPGSFLLLFRGSWGLAATRPAPLGSSPGTCTFLCHPSGLSRSALTETPVSAGISPVASHALFPKTHLCGSGVWIGWDLHPSSVA